MLAIYFLFSFVVFDSVHFIDFCFVCCLINQVPMLMLNSSVCDDRLVNRTMLNLSHFSTHEHEIIWCLISFLFLFSLALCATFLFPSFCFLARFYCRSTRSHSLHFPFLMQQQRKKRKQNKKRARKNFWIKVPINQ